MADWAHGDGIITLGASDSQDFNPVELVEFIMVTSTAAGSFPLQIGEVPITVVTGAADLTKIIPVNRHAKSVATTGALPTGGAVYVFLRKK